MRLLVINPNTSAAITQKVATAVAPLLPAGASVVASTGRFGAPYIATRAAAAVAAHAALDCYARDGAGCDGVLLACFGDPGLEALKEVADAPVVGLADAAIRLAAARGARLGVVTGGERWGPMLRDFVAERGLTAHLACVRTVAPTGAEIAADPDRAIAQLAEACAACAREDGADMVALAGAGLVGLARRAAALAGVDVMCSVELGLQTLLTQMRAPRAAAPPARGLPSHGLSPDLARLFAERLPG